MSSSDTRVVELESAKARLAIPIATTRMRASRATCGRMTALRRMTSALRAVNVDAK